MTTLPRVSEILSILSDDYADVPHESLQRAAERGTALHGLCCQHLASMMGLCPKPSAIEAEHVAAYMGFLEWVEQRKVKPILVETDSVNLRDGYRGTPDALVQYGNAGPIVLVDLKFTAALFRRNRIQIQAYWKMKSYTEAKEAYLLKIDHETGAWEEIPVVQNPRDWIAFASALNVWTWRQA